MARLLVPRAAPVGSAVAKNRAWFVDEGRVLVNNYSQVDERYGSALSRILRGAGLAG